MWKKYSFKLLCQLIGIANFLNYKEIVRILLFFTPLRDSKSIPYIRKFVTSEFVNLSPQKIARIC